MGASSGSSSRDDDNYFPPTTTPTNSTDWGLMGSNQAGTWSIDMDYDPIQDFTNWISGKTKKQPPRNMSDEYMSFYDDDIPSTNSSDPNKNPDYML